MPIRITSIYKSHQPGDLAGFPDAEAESIVRGGAGLVEDPQSAFERTLFELQSRLPAQPVIGRVAEIAARPVVAGDRLTDETASIPLHQGATAPAGPAAVTAARHPMAAEATPVPDKTVAPETPSKPEPDFKPEPKPEPKPESKPEPDAREVQGKVETPGKVDKKPETQAP